MGYPRNKRISEEIKKIVSQLIMYDIKDPRIPAMTSVTHVDTTNDLRFTTIYISILDSSADRQKALEGLNSAKGFIRREIGTELKLHYTPEPLFKIDESIENSIYMNKLISSVTPREPEAEVEDESGSDSDDKEDA